MSSPIDDLPSLASKVAWVSGRPIREVEMVLHHLLISYTADPRFSPEDIERYSRNLYGIDEQARVETFAAYDDALDVASGNWWATANEAIGATLQHIAEGRVELGINIPVLHASIAFDVVFPEVERKLVEQFMNATQHAVAVIAAMPIEDPVHLHSVGVSVRYRTTSIGNRALLKVEGADAQAAVRSRSLPPLRWVKSMNGELDPQCRDSLDRLLQPKLIAVRGATRVLDRINRRLR